MTIIDLTKMRNERSNSELQELELGQIVSVDGKAGIIAAFVEKPFEFPAEGEDPADDDPEMREIDASSQEPVYIVALMEGGSVAATRDEISTDATITGEEGEEIKSFDDVADEAPEANLAEVYEYTDNPGSLTELQEAKKKLIHERHATELAEYVDDSDVTLATLEELSYEELLNIPGVDDPEVGFSDLPEGWTRKSVLQAWASLGGMWRTCFARMVRVRGPRFARRWCSALKDEVLQTELWRGRF